MDADAASAAIYDGDLSAWRRRRVREVPPNLVLADPPEGLVGGVIYLLREATTRGLCAIVYCQSRKLTELLAVWAARGAGALAPRIRAYRAGLRPDERRDLERRLAQGDLLALITTSALELGIDIGGLALCILVGYPGSVVATLQRAGRVGRGGQESALVVVAGEDALDRYFLRHPQALFDGKPEAVVVNVENPQIVGRETERLDESAVARAAVETVAENLVDGIVAPLFFALLGGAPLAMAYKMVNTLDSMVGYRSPRYIEFGRASARLDDAANFIPARLSLPLIVAAARLGFGRGAQAWRIGRRDARRHASPNSGFPEAAFAGALGVRLGGPNRYHGQVVEKPFIGEELREVAITDIRRACRLMVFTTLLAALLAVGWAVW